MAPSLLLQHLERETHNTRCSRPERSFFKNFSVPEPAPMPMEHTALSERERQAVEQVAQQRGVTFEEALEQMAKEGLAKRVRKGTGRAPARVYELRKKP